MAIRTTATAVKLIIETDVNIVLGDDTGLDPFIETASAIVDDHLTDAGYDSTRLEQIERWLAAHCYAHRDPRATNETARGVGQQFQFRIGLGLNQTTFGQMAMRLDKKGILAAWDKALSEGRGTTVALDWLGLAEEDRGDL